MNSSFKVFAAACGGLLVFGMAMLSLGTVNTYLADTFHLDQLGVGSLAALLPLGILTGSLLFGPVSDRYGYKIPLVTATLLMSTGFFAIAQASSVVVLQAAFFAIGAGGGAINGGGSALVADISGDAKGARLSTLGVFFGLGALGMPMITNVLKNFFPLSSIIMGVGAFTILPAIAMMVIEFPKPKLAQGFPIARGAELLKSPVLLALSMVLFFESAAEGLVNNWTAAFIQRTGRINPDSALIMLSILAAALTVARGVFGAMLRPSNQRRILVQCLISALVGAGLLLVAETTTVAALSMVLLGFGFAAAFPVILGIVANEFPELSGTAIGIALVIALTGNTVLNYGLGAAAQTWGLQVFPGYLLGVLGGLGVFLALGLRATRPGKSAK